MSKGSVLGLGVDLVDNQRVRESLEKWGDRFKKRVFLPDEQAYCDKMPDPGICGNGFVYCWLSGPPRFRRRAGLEPFEG